MFSTIFINRPNTTIVIAIILVLLGTLSVFNLPVSQFPEITPPTVQVTGTFTGADAQTVEQNVTTPIETQINGTPGMDYIQSNSTNDGRSTINVTLDLGTNVDIAALDIQNRVSIATPQLPSDVKQLGLTVRKRDPNILMIAAIYSPKGTHDITFLDNYSNIYVRDALLRVKGVGDIYTVGNDFSMRIWLQPEKLAQLGLTATDVTNALAEQNLQVAAGAIGASPQPRRQDFEYSVFLNSRLNREEQFRKIVIRTKPNNGSIVYLEDVARIQLAKFTYGVQAYADGKPSTFLIIYQAPGSNSLQTSEGVVKQLEALKQTFPKDLDYVVPYETVTVVRVSIQEVVKTLGIALLLVLLVVYIFLQSWRATLIPMLVVPISIVGSFSFFILLGFTINTLTLFAFVLAIGIVVDDAIVVVEAVQQYIDNEKLSAKDATFKAMKDISGPVIAIALILAAVFVPVGFIPGIIGKLYQQFAITIAISVLISAFLALSLTPALCSIMLRPMALDSHSKGLNRLFFGFNQWFQRRTAGYSRNVQALFKKTPYVVVLLVCLFIGTIVLFERKPTGFIPNEDQGLVLITFDLPESSSLTRTGAILDSIESRLKDLEGIKHYSGVVGLNVVTFAAKSSSGTLFVQLRDWDDRKSKSLQLEGMMAEMNLRFASIKEANIIVIQPPAISGLGQTGGFTFELQQKESTDDIKGFERVTNNFLAALNRRPEISYGFTFFNARTPGYNVEVDREKCKKMGVSLADVFGTVQTFLGSRYVNDFALYGRNFKVVAQADEVYRMDLSDLGKYYVRNVAGTMVPVSTLIRSQLTESPSMVSHYDLFRSAEINGNAKPGYSSGQAIAALKEVAAQVLPAGYGYSFSGLTKEELSSGNSSLYIFALSIVFVFLLLVALYESWSIPFSVLLAVPIGVFGAILALTLLPKLDNNIYAQIGLITLIGLAAKNAILIVEFANERVIGGMDAIPATLEAVKLRLRPIIMTSLAFILGVLPLAFATGAASVSRSTIGWTVLGGMLAATSLAIFTVPVLFVLINGLSRRRVAGAAS